MAPTITAVPDTRITRNGLDDNIVELYGRAFHIPGTHQDAENWLAEQLEAMETDPELFAFFDPPFEELPDTYFKNGDVEQITPERVEQMERPKRFVYDVKAATAPDPVNRKYKRPNFNKSIRF